jgi:hypothetical protein
VKWGHISNLGSSPRIWVIEQAQGSQAISFIA